jgi:hypothetical protein
MDMPRCPLEPAASEWNPPPEFDLIKELNGHAARLATLLGLVVAAVAFSLGNGPLKDSLTSFDLSAHAFVYGALVVVGLCVFFGGASVLNVLTPAIPSYCRFLWKLDAGLAPGRVKEAA